MVTSSTYLGGLVAAHLASTSFAKSGAATGDWDAMPKSSLFSWPSSSTWPNVLPSAPCAALALDPLSWSMFCWPSVVGLASPDRAACSLMSRSRSLRESGCRARPTRGKRRVGNESPLSAEANPSLKWISGDSAFHEARCGSVCAAH